MRLSDISESQIQYGNSVTIKDANSKYSNMVGKVTKVNGVTAEVRFEGIKKPVAIMVDALEKI